MSELHFITSRASIHARQGEHMQSEILRASMHIEHTVRSLPAISTQPLGPKLGILPRAVDRLPPTHLCHELASTVAYSCWISSCLSSCFDISQIEVLQHSSARGESCSLSQGQRGGMIDVLHMFCHQGARAAAGRAQVTDAISRTVEVRANYVCCLLCPQPNLSSMK